MTLNFKSIICIFKITTTLIFNEIILSLIVKYHFMNFTTYYFYSILIEIFLKYNYPSINTIFSSNYLNFKFSLYFKLIYSIFIKGWNTDSMINIQYLSWLFIYCKWLYFSRSINSYKVKQYTALDWNEILIL